MEARNSWGVVYVAAFFALVLIGVAYGIHTFQQGQKNGAVVATAKDFSDWQSVSSVAPTTTTKVNTALSDTLSGDLYSGYVALTQKGAFTETEKKQMLTSIIKKDVQPQKVVPLITVSQLTVVPATSVNNYISLVAVILHQSVQIKQEESFVFSGAVQNQVTTGTPLLIQDADLYRRMAKALLAMEVPPQVVSEHVELVKSVFALSNTVRNMGEWRGDPIEALADIDTYGKVKTYLENSANNLTAAVEKLENSQKS